MEQKHHKLYCDLRAELVMKFNHDNNKNYLCTKEHALEVAKQRLNAELSGGGLLISIEELLLYTLEECQCLVDHRIAQRGEKIKMKILNNN